MLRSCRLDFFPQIRFQIKSGRPCRATRSKLNRPLVSASDPISITNIQIDAYAQAVSTETAMSNRKNPHYEHAAARHRATGKEQKFEGQWQLLHAIMLRNDLSLAAYRVAYLLYAIRLNSKSSLCFTTDSRMAADLGLNIRTIERAKKEILRLRSQFFCRLQFLWSRLK